MRKLIILCIAAALAAFSLPATAQPKDKPAKTKPEKRRPKPDKDKPDKDKPKKDKKDKKAKPDKKAKSDKSEKGHDHGTHKHEHGDDHAGHNKDKHEDHKPGTNAGSGQDKTKQIADEKRKHLKRLAKIRRLAELGSEHSKPKLVEKAKMLREKENARHERAVKRLSEAAPANAEPDKPGKDGKPPKTGEPAKSAKEDK